MSYYESKLTCLNWPLSTDVIQTQHHHNMYHHDITVKRGPNKAISSVFHL